jgi:hypothetical protein
VYSDSDQNVWVADGSLHLTAIKVNWRDTAFSMPLPLHCKLKLVLLVEHVPYLIH